MKKKPRFFCDNCACEVGSEKKSCPHCGRFFASTRCPACGYSGEDRMFKDGCPMCGYSSIQTSGSKKINKKSKLARPTRPAFKPTSSSFWTYVAAAFVLLAVITLLSYCITR
ncbi:MAG: hypothetical protein FWC97_09790 [Treponema sp.]|nr:hypothetical protein [Treponema sp.]